MKKKILFKNWLLVILLSVCLVMQMFGPTRVMAVVLIVLGGLFLISLAWALSLANTMKVEREIRFGWAQVGDHLEERFILTNQGAAPALWVEFLDQSTLPGHDVNRATGVDGRTQVEWHASSVCTRRGLYTLGPTLLRCSDPFGLFKVELTNPAQRTVMVMPPVVALPGIQIAAGGQSGDGKPRHNAPERTVSASGVREFAPGDSLRWIHWPTTARRQQYFVRQFDGTPAGDWRILVDLNQAVQKGSGWDSTEEHAVILAASLADQGLRLKRPVGLTLNGEPFTWLAARPDETQRWEILRSLALAKSSPTPLSSLLARLRYNMPAHASLILITADASGEWLPQLLPLLWRGVTPTILLIDSATFEPPAPAGPDSLPSPAAALAEELGRNGIHHVIINHEFLNRPEARPGHSGEWEWRVSATGRAVAVNSPGDLSWRRLG